MRAMKKVHEMDLAILCHQFSLILKSGIHPVEGIPLLMEDTRSPVLKRALEGISRDALSGISLAEAFVRANCFPAYLTAMVKVGEQTGMLETVMESLSQFYEGEADIRKSIRSSVSYPLVLAVLITAVIALISLKVIPMFIGILTSLGGEIPTQVKFLLTLGGIFRDGLIYLLIILAAVAAIVFALGRIQGVRVWMDKLKLTNPITGPTYKKITASRYSGALALTLKNGMSLMEGIGVISCILSNRHVSRKTQEIAQAITAGGNFSEAIQKARLFPELFVRLTKTGEKTGALDSMMQKISDIYKQEVDRSLKRVISYIEPVCVTLLSLVLAGVLLSVILPLINIMSSIG